jgi:hypothetical protein
MSNEKGINFLALSLWYFIKISVSKYNILTYNKYKYIIRIIYRFVILKSKWVMPKI